MFLVEKFDTAALQFGVWNSQRSASVTGKGSDHWRRPRCKETGRETKEAETE